ncbi:MAG TPA: metallophosphoesterase [Polyangia bacterium]
MARWSTLAAMMLVLGGVIVAGHRYLWARLIRDAGVGSVDQRVWILVLTALAVGIPLAVVMGRLVPPALSTWWLTPVYYWLGVSALLVLAVAAVDLGQALFALIGNGQSGGESVDPERRRAFARVGAVAALVMAVPTSAWAAVEGRRLRVKRVEVPLAKLPAALDGFRIVQLTDVHLGPTVGRTFIERMVAMVNELSPDLIAITGDLVDASVEDLREDVAPLAKLTSKHGAYFVTGNHEYHADAPRWCEHLGQLGVRVLRNECVSIERGGSVIHLAGVDDFEAAGSGVGHGMDLNRALEGRDHRPPLVLLAHQPKAVHEASRLGVDLQLSGHTHGGQLWPLGWFHRLTQPVVAGLAKFGKTWLYVSCGTGHSGPPMRLAAPAEISEIILRVVSPTAVDPAPAGHPQAEKSHAS